MPRLSAGIRISLKKRGGPTHRIERVRQPVGRCGGLKFRRQHPIEPYIVDFYCAQANLVVEIDGESHEGRQDHDRRRDEYLEKLGLRIMRVANDRVLENLDGVAELLQAVIEAFVGCNRCAIANDKWERAVTGKLDETAGIAYRALGQYPNSCVH